MSAIITETVRNGTPLPEPIRAANKPNGILANRYCCVPLLIPASGKGRVSLFRFAGTPGGSQSRLPDWRRGVHITQINRGTVRIDWRYMMLQWQAMQRHSETLNPVRLQMHFSKALSFSRKRVSGCGDGKPPSNKQRDNPARCRMVPLMSRALRERPCRNRGKTTCSVEGQNDPHDVTPDIVIGMLCNMLYKNQ